MITRRKFIQNNALLATALMIDPSALWKFHKSLGLQLYTVRDEEKKDFNNTLSQVASLGYTHVELHGYDENRLTFGRSSQQLADLLKQKQLIAPSGHYGLNDMLYEQTYKWESWRHVMTDAKNLGHKYVVIPWLKEEHRTMEDFKRIADRLNKGAQMSNEEGITTAYHNHDFELKEIDGVLPLEYLLNNTDKKLVKFELDIYWMTRAGHNPIEWINNHPKRFELWHIKDMAAPTAAEPIGDTCEVGSGTIDWKAIFEQKEVSGLEYAFVEQDRSKRPIYESIKMSADYMKANLLK